MIVKITLEMTVCCSKIRIFNNVLFVSLTGLFHHLPFVCLGFRCGDLLVAVDGESVEGLSHSEVVNMLRKDVNSVTLSVVSWPGTLI